MNTFNYQKHLINILITITAALTGPVALAQGQPSATLAVLGFELVDDQPDPARTVQLQSRLTAITKQLERGLQERSLYRVIDIATAQDLITLQRERNEFLYRCSNCLVEVGQRLDTRLIAVGWVQRVSELILNINVSVLDSQTGAEVLSKSVDLRGNTDETWQRGINFMLRDWSERRARNPNYGR